MELQLSVLEIMQLLASYAANLFNIKNKIFLYKSANQFRVQSCKNLNANIIFTDPEVGFPKR